MEQVIDIEKAKAVLDLYNLFKSLTAEQKEKAIHEIEKVHIPLAEALKAIAAEDGTEAQGRA